MRSEELNIPCPECGSVSTITYFVIDGITQSVCKKCAGMWVEEEGKIVEDKS